MQIIRHLVGSWVVWALLFAALALGVEGEVEICRYHGGDAGEVADSESDADEEAFRYAPHRNVDILHIKLDVTPDFKLRTVAGTTTITFEPIARALDQLTLDAVNLTIGQVRSSAPIDEYVATAKDLTIAFAPPVAPGTQVRLEIDHQAQPSRGFYFRTPEMGYPASDTHCWTQGESHEARHWFPCFDYPNERSSTEIVCPVPSDMTVLSNGRRLAEQVDPRTGLKMVHWRQDKPHVSYLICLVAGYFEKLEKTYRDVPLAFYTQPSLFEHAANSFADTADIMAFFDEEIGVPFPWDKYYQVTIADFVVSGMENTSLTTLTDRTIFTSATENIRTTRSLDAHEMAHQWFGDYVTCKDWSHIWLNEGFATYYAHLYEGHKFGRDAMLYGLYRDATREVLTKRSNPKPIVWKGYRDADEQFDYRAYPKGSWLLHMLRCQLGEPLYRQCIQEYLERHALGSVVTEDLNQVIEELSGRSFDQFFDQWVYHAGHPELKVSYRWLPAQKLAHVSVEQTHEVSDDVLLFRFPTAVRFIVEGKNVDHAIEISKKKHDFYVPLASRPSMVRFDPGYTVLASVTFEKDDPMLFAELANPEDVIGRLLAAKALSKRKTHESVEHLARALRTDPFFGVRMAASSALAAIGNDEACEALAASVDQDDARVRRRVVDDLGTFYRHRTLELLKEILTTENNPAIQAEAIRALGRFHGDQSSLLIQQYLRSESFRNELADAAIEAIGMQNAPQYRGELREVLSAREQAFTSRGLGAGLATLARISRDQENKDQERQFISGYLNHPKEQIRIAAVRALGTLGDRATMAVLEPLARDDRGDRLAAAAKEALESLQQEAPLVPEELVELRKLASQIKEDNEQLRKDVDELKKQLEAVDETDEDEP